MRIAMFEGYRRRPKFKRKARRGKRSYKGVSAKTKARRKLFGKVVKACYAKGTPKSKMGACIRVGLKKRK